MNTLYIHMAILGSSRSKGIIREGLYKGVDCEYIVLADINKSSGCTEGRNQTCKATSTHYCSVHRSVHQSTVIIRLLGAPVLQIETQCLI